MNPSDSSGALSQLQTLQSQSQDPNTILSGQRQQLGVQGAQDTVTGLRGAINNTTKLLQQVAPSVMGRTGSSLVTNAQATKQIGNEQAPISQNLSNQTTDYNQADQNLTKLQQQAQEAASGIYQGQQDKLSYAQNLYNTLYQKEQNAQAAQAAEAARQEQIREFNEQLSASKAAAGSGSFNLPGAQSTPAAKQYVGNNDLRGRLSYLGTQGDGDAKLALKYVGNDGKYNLDPSKVDKSVISALNKFGFVNTFKTPSAPSTPNKVSSAANNFGSNFGLSNLMNAFR